MAVNTTPYATQAVFNKSLRFFKTDGDHVNAWVAHEDVVAALGHYEWGTRVQLDGSTGCLPGSILSGDPGIASEAPMQVLVSGVGNLNCILTTVATSMMRNLQMNGVAGQQLRDATVTAIAAGAAALP
jgi:hypothetical protein